MRRVPIATICRRMTSTSRIRPRRDAPGSSQQHIAMPIPAIVATPSIAQPKAAYRVLGALSASHMINDMMQSLILAMYPILKGISP